MKLNGMNLTLSEHTEISDFYYPSAPSQTALSTQTGAADITFEETMPPAAAQMVLASERHDVSIFSSIAAAICKRGICH
jgi:hypothetical protein